MPSERWKNIHGHRDYEISSRGRVRSKKRGRAKLMKTRVGDDDYLRVTLQDDQGNKVVRRIHILVARAFLGPANGRMVLHKDGDYENPDLSNLRYGSGKDNNADKYRHGTHGMGSRNSQALLKESEVIDIFDNPDGWYQQELADYYGISRQAVSDIQNGVTWQKVTRA